MKNFVLVILSVMLLASCKMGKQKEAVAYNNDLVMFQRGMGTQVQQGEQQIGVYAKAKDSAKLFAAIDAVLQTVYGEKKKLEGIKFSGDDFGMKKELSAALDFLVKTYKDDYPKWMGAQIKANEDPAAIQKIQEEAMAVQKVGAELDKKFLEAQKKFAKEYTIILQ